MLLGKTMSSIYYKSLQNPPFLDQLTGTLIMSTKSQKHGNTYQLLQLWVGPIWIFLRSIRTTHRFYATANLAVKSKFHLTQTDFPHSEYTLRLTESHKDIRYISQLNTIKGYYFLDQNKAHRQNLKCK